VCVRVCVCVCALCVCPYVLCFTQLSTMRRKKNDNLVLAFWRRKKMMMMVALSREKYEIERHSGSTFRWNHLF